MGLNGALIVVLTASKNTFEKLITNVSFQKPPLCHIQFSYSNVNKVINKESLSKKLPAEAGNVLVMSN